MAAGTRLHAPEADTHDHPHERLGRVDSAPSPIRPPMARSRRNRRFTRPRGSRGSHSELSSIITCTASEERLEPAPNARRPAECASRLRRATELYHRPARACRTRRAAPYRRRSRQTANSWSSFPNQARLGWSASFLRSCSAAPTSARMMIAVATMMFAARRIGGDVADTPKRECPHHRMSGDGEDAARLGGHRVGDPGLGSAGLRTIEPISRTDAAHCR